MQSIFSEESQAISQRSRCVLNIMQVFAGEPPRLPSERRMQPSMNVQRAKLLPDLWTLLEHNEKQICPFVPECLNASAALALADHIAHHVHADIGAKLNGALKLGLQAWAKLFN
ncbi:MULTISPECIES: hypothetical protein [Bradyrhizobium]|uniref:hypothetical protein n=1 Tax=Bradyrhizobium TaxID=374 RepID=UPI000481AE3E|nr:MULTISPECIES: hypothetical protein [Bradyrhizobium]UFW51081.1 hypothetical protein BaraCB756_08650 [Bradyrhizobium arachidis]